MDMDTLIQEALRHVFLDGGILFDRSRFAGGLTNYNYIMEIHGAEYVVRKPGVMSNEMIDRKIEAVNNSIASAFGINSDCVYFDAETGIKISRYIKNSKNMAFSDPCDTANLGHVSGLLRKIHTSARHFPNTFDWRAELKKYEHLIRRLHGESFSDYAALKQQLFDFITQNAGDWVYVPCHNDTVPENFILDESGRPYLIDWEYSGMNDACWDLAVYIIESRLTPEAVRLLFQGYYGGVCPGHDAVKIKCCMMAQDLLWAVWALVKHYSGDDFLDYCQIRYDRFKRNLKTLTRLPGYPISEMVAIP